MNLYKTLLAGFAIFAAGLTANAQVNTIEIGNPVTDENTGAVDWIFSITPGLKTYAPVVVNFEDPVDALQFDLTLPDGVSLTKNVIKNTELVPASDNIVITGSGTNYRVMLVSPKAQSLIKRDGVLMQLEFEADASAFDLYPQLPLSLSNIVLTNAQGTEEYTSSKPEAESIIEMGIAHLALTSPEAAEDSENIINPGGRFKVSLGMDNTVEAAGLQTYITLPEGMVIDENSFEFTERGYVDGSKCDMSIDYNNEAKTEWTFLVYRYDGKNAITGESGVFVTFDVVANDEIAKEDLKIIFSNFEISYGTMSPISFSGDGLTINLINGIVSAYNNAQTSIQNLRDKLAATVEEIKNTCPDVAEDFDGAYVEAYIAQMEATVQVGYEEGSLLEIDMDQWVADVDAMIDQYAENAKAQQTAVEEDNNRIAANQEAYQADLTAIDELQLSLDAAVNDLKETAPSYDSDEAAAAIQAQIDDMKAQADAAIEAVEFEGTYENTVDSESVLAAIDKMVEDAKTSGIGTITVDNVPTNAKVFTLTGVKVAAPVKNAVNIIVLEDGRTMKAIVK